ncbi:TetR/AcrR family transcriptional regulator [Fodinicola acaciae]|uniref:TetR/AcrR family transcriptional regulator n=1 Tax=Fodinicola acaciae TaxID=2681555 RepID=UPI0013D54110|nr:TetR/AcrR family transcriptional regulator [Fodinicola acaciae]
MSAGTVPGKSSRPSRKEQILEIALELFATRGYHGVGMDDIGTAAGVTGPALYHHFAGKEAMLSAALIPVSEGLRDGGRARLDAHTEPADQLAALVEFHVAFALERPAVIRIHFGELDRLPDESRRIVRKSQREYVEQWVDVLTRLQPGLDADTARVRAQAAFGLMNSTPFLRSQLPREQVAGVLRDMVHRALRG